MSRVERILMRTRSAEFAEIVKETTDDLMEVVRATVIGSVDNHKPESESDDWERFYLPAMRRDVYLSLAAEAKNLAKGWESAFYNALREANDNG